MESLLVFSGLAGTTAPFLSSHPSSVWKVKPLSRWELLQLKSLVSTSPGDAKTGAATYMSVVFGCQKFAWYLLLVSSWKHDEQTGIDGTPVLFAIVVCVHVRVCMCVCGGWGVSGCACVRVWMSNQTNPTFICCGRSVCHIQVNVTHRGLQQTDGEPRPRPRPACNIYGCLGTAAKQWCSGLLIAAAIPSQSPSSTLGSGWR